MQHGTKPSTGFSGNPFKNMQSKPSLAGIKHSSTSALNSLQLDSHKQQLHYVDYVQLAKRTFVSSLKIFIKQSKQLTKTLYKLIMCIDNFAKVSRISLGLQILAEKCPS